MANRALYFARRGIKMCGNGRIKLFGDGIDHLGRMDDDFNGLPQILISLDMSGDADGKKNARDFFIEGFALHELFAARHLAHMEKIQQALIDKLHMKRLDHIVLGSKLQGAGDEGLAAQRREDDGLGHFSKLAACKFLCPAPTVSHLRKSAIGISVGRIGQTFLTCIIRRYIFKTGCDTVVHIGIKILRQHFVVLCN